MTFWIQIVTTHELISYFPWTVLAREGHHLQQQEGKKGFHVRFVHTKNRGKYNASSYVIF